MKKSTFLFSFATFLCLFSQKGFGQANFSASPPSGCAPLNVTFTDLSAGATSWSWDFGNGNTSTIQNPTAQYQLAGDFTVVLTINGGTSSFSMVIHVYAAPVAAFTIDDDTTCVNGSILFTSTSIPGSGVITSYQWSFGDGNISTGNFPTISHTYVLAGSFTVNLSIIDANGCQSVTGNQNIFVILAPAASFTTSPNSTCVVPQNVAFTNTTSPAANSYTWNFGDPGSGSANTSTLPAPPDHIYSTNGNYSITLIATSGNCSDTVSQVFTASPIAADFTAIDSVCQNQSVVFTNTTVPPPASAIWSFGDGGVSNLVDPVHTYTGSGWFTVTMIAQVGTGPTACSDTIVDSVYIHPLPTFTLFTNDDSTWCEPPATIDFQSTGDANINNWHWTFGTGDTSNLQNPTYIYTGYGIFSVTLAVTNVFGCTATLSHPNYIHIVAPTVNILNQPDSGCANTDSFTFNAISTNVQGDSTIIYSWNFGDGTTQNNGPTVSHTYSQCGYYTVSVQITTSGLCTAVDTIQDLIRTGFPPTANFTWDPSVMCYGDTVTFRDTTIANGCPVTAWLWDFGSTLQHPTHVFPDTGMHDVTLVAFSNGCPDSMEQLQIITILPPKPIFTYYYNCTDPYQVQFYDTSHGDEWVTWNFGDGTPTDSTNAQSIIHTFPSTGNYTVTLHAYNFTHGCDFATTSTISIYDPSANISVTSSQGCHPFTATFDGTSSVDEISYSWDFGDPASGTLNTSFLPSPTHVYNLTGYDTVTLIVTDAHGCTDDTTYVIYTTGPEASFVSPDTTGCRPFSATFNSTSSSEGSVISQYIWNYEYPGGINDTTTTPNGTHQFLSSGAYTIYLLVIDAAGCRDSTSINSFITVTYPDAVIAANDTFICDSMQVTFTATSNDPLGAPYTYEWNFGDGTANVINSNDFTGSNIESHTFYLTDTVLPVQVTITDVNGCDSTVTQNITILRPSAQFTVTHADSCGYTQAFFDGPSGDSIYSWLWVPNGPFNYTGLSPVEDPEFQFNIPGWYGASLTVTNPGCSTTLSLDSLMLVPGPQASFTYPPTTHCPPVSITFTSHLVSGTYEYILWNFGGGESGITYYPDSVITHTYYSDGVYLPTAQIAYALGPNDTCMYVDTNLTGQNIIVQSYMSLIASPDTILMVEGGTDTLTSALTNPSNTSPYIYTWTVYPDGTILNNYLNTMAIYTNTSSHNDSVILVVEDNAGCQVRDTVQIIIYLCESEIIIPNVFTPNNDGKNDEYYIKDLCPLPDFLIRIYNRWGNIVYESEDYAFRWDGMNSNGNECTDGVYYYTLHAKKSDIHGYIHLIRGKSE